MNDMLRIARRGLEVLQRAPVPLFVASAAWTLLNAMTPWLDLGPLLLGPALLGLFHVALKALRNQETTWQDAFIAVREPTTALVAGVLFALPFTIWSQMRSVGQAMEVSMFATDSSAIPGVPMIMSLFVLIFFAVYVFVFVRLADVGGTIQDAVVFAHRLAEKPGRPDSRVSGFARQLIYCGFVFLAVLIVGFTWRLNHGVPFLFSFLIAPPAAALLVAWHDDRAALPDHGTADAPGDGPGSDDDADN